MLAISKELATRSLPQVLVLHLDENDIINHLVVQFLARLVEDISKIQKLVRCLCELTCCPGMSGVVHGTQRQ